MKSMSKSSVPDMGTAYVSYMPLLMSILGRLTREGFQTTPDEGHDLIHDFFTWEWRKIKDGYNPAKGSFKSYLSGWFVFYSKRKIDRLRRWKNSLVGTSHLASLVERETNDFVSQSDSEQVGSALRRLPEIQHRLLMDYLEHGPRSMSRLAREHKKNRYRIRLLLSEAFTRLIVILGETQFFNENEWPVARKLWYENLSFETVAGTTGLSVPVVKRMRREMLEHIADEVLSLSAKGEGHERNLDMNTDTQLSTNECLLLLRKAMTTSGDESVLDELARNRKVILIALGDQDLDLSPEDQEIIESQSEWMERIYEALGETDISDEDARELAELIEAKEQDDRSIGMAFKDELVEGLSPNLQKWDVIFEGVSTIDDKNTLRNLKENPDVVAAQPAVGPLLRYGVTPLVVFYAIKSVRVMVDFLIEREIIRHDEWMQLPDDRIDQENVIPLDELLDEIVAQTERSRTVARALLAWIIKVIKDDHPHLISGLQTLKKGDNVWVQRSSGEKSALECWQRERIPVFGEV